jgi:hypothetical protein
VLVAGLMALAATTAMAQTAHAASAGAGSVRFVQKASNSEFDRFTMNPSAAQKQNMRNLYSGMIVSSPYFDRRLKWFPNAWAYRGLYTAFPGAAIVRQHPSWFLRERTRTGALAHVPFDCEGGTCPQVAADIANPGFRRHWIRDAQTLVRRGYKTLYIDDVNMIRRVSDGTGKELTPYSPYKRKAISRHAWRVYVARFTRQIRRSIPRRVKIVHNVIWFAPSSKDRLTRIQMRSASIIALERGINDPGLVGGRGYFGLNNYLNYASFIHKLKRPVLFDENTASDDERDYGLAGYFLINNGRDYFGSSPSGNPNSFFSGYRVKLGKPVGGRKRSRGGLFRRDFQNGVVLLNEPGAATKTVALKGNYRTADGRAVGSSITLAASRGAVLVRSR